MKKIITLVVCCCCAAIFASDLELKNEINNSKIGDPLMKGWLLNQNRKEGLGTGIVIQGSENDSKAYKITSKKFPTFFFKRDAIRAKAGDKIKFSVDVKGRGTMIIGFYTYAHGNKFIDAVNTRKIFAVNGKEQEIEYEFTVPNGNKGDLTGTIRPFIAANANSEVIFEDLEIEIDYKNR